MASRTSIGLQAEGSGVNLLGASARLPGAWREAPRFAFFRHDGIYRSDGGWAVRQGSPLRGCALSSPWEGKRSAVSLESLGSVEGEFRSPQRARDGKQRPLGGYRKQAAWTDGRRVALPRKWRARQSSPYTGKPSARPAGKPGDSFVEGGFATIPCCHSCLFIPRRLGMRFFRHGGIYRSDVVQKQKPNPGAGAVPPPVGRPRTQVKERAGRFTPFSSSAMSSGRLFLEGLLASRALLRFTDTGRLTRHFRMGDHRVTFLLCQPGGHFYFAATLCHPPLEHRASK